MGSPPDEPTGTRFEAWGRQSKRLDQLKAHKAVAQLTTELATYVAVNRDVEVIYDGQRIDPEKSIQRRDEYELAFTVNGGPVQAARLRVVEWSIKTDRELHRCDADGITVDITDVGIHARRLHLHRLRAVGVHARASGRLPARRGPAGLPRRRVDRHRPGAIVLAVYVIAGWDPIVRLFFWLTVLGGLGVLILMTATSAAVAAYFASPGNRDHLGPGQTLLAPFTAAVGLALVLLVTLDEFATLLGVDPTSSLRWQLPATYAVAAVAGVGCALILKSTRPQAYTAIGRGANSATIDLHPPTRAGR